MSENDGLIEETPIMNNNPFSYENMLPHQPIGEISVKPYGENWFLSYSLS